MCGRLGYSRSDWKPSPTCFWGRILDEPGLFLACSILSISEKKWKKTARVRVPVTSLTSHPLRHLIQQSGQSLFSRTASASCHSVSCPAFIHHTDQGEGTLLSPIGQTQNSCPLSLEPKGPAQRLGHPKLSAVG